MRIRFRRRGALETVDAEVVAAETDALVVGFTQTQKNQNPVTRALKLRGRWQVDPANRLSFTASGGSVRPAKFLFSGTWKTGKRHELTYRLDRSGKPSSSLSFDGFWRWDAARGLSYTLAGDGGRHGDQGALRLRGAFQTESVLAKRGELRYQFGAEVKKGPRSRTISLFGKWKLGRGWALDFELEGGRARSRTFSFGAAYSFGPDKRLRASLFDDHGRPLGVEVAFENDWPGGSAFARLRRTAEESIAEAGYAIRW